jgi:osmotically-inducible protein OsmY
MKNDESVYRAERIREALATEPDVAELDIEVAVVGERVVLRATVSSERRRAHILEHVRRLCPDLEIDDELRVETLREPKTEVL